MSAEAKASAALEGLAPTHVPGGRNLVHYLALRAQELRPLQDELQVSGLSSLGRTEPHVMATLDAVLRQLRHNPEWFADWPDFAMGRESLTHHTDELFGAPSDQRVTRIMVTMPSEAATDPGLTRALLSAGMDCMRVNCAHDDEATWRAMIENMRRARTELNAQCSILMDIGGPKLRTGPVEATAGIAKWRPRRDDRGRVVEPATVRLVPAGGDQSNAAGVPVVGLDPLAIEIGDVLRFTDVRSSRRELHVVAVSPGGVECTIAKTAYVEEGIELTAPRLRRRRPMRIGALAPRETPIIVRRDEVLEIHRDMVPGSPAALDEDGAVRSPARISCSLPEVFARVQVGERVLIDDGLIGGIVENVSAEMLTVRVTDTVPCGGRIRADKGLNFPDTDLQLPALGARDREALAFIAREADMVGFSFVHTAADVRELQDELRRLGRSDLGIVLKIETARAFENTPVLLLEAMRSERVGLMIARGDLGVECGFERLAELQEELLWIAEAAHVPAIWATQVLDTMARTGVPSRAEITDAAMGERAECVMLNKGPHIVPAVGVLADILRRMQGHQRKKVSLLRRLGSWSSIDEPSEDAQTNPVSAREGG